MLTISLSFLSSLFLFFWKNLFYIFLVGLIFLLNFVFLFFSFSFVEYFNFYNIFMMDMVSYSLIVLSFWITILMYCSSMKTIISAKGSIFFWMVFILMVVLVLTFSTSNFLWFYFFFEVSLLPTLVIIMGWGYQPERIQAGIYFLFYTMTASLPLLLGLCFIYKQEESLSIFLNFSMKHSSIFVFLIFSSAFLVKMPMFFVHLWLPKAHVEAPVAGSMILAGVLLKLGGYGLFRIITGLNKLNSLYGGYLFGLSIAGMFFVGLICCRLNDLKALVAYSSVAHMGLVICGYFSFNYWGYLGSLGMMISHGLASSGLFCAVNMYYERSGSRSFYLNKGLISYFPIFSMFFFLACAANMAAPPTLNLVSEIMLMVSMMKYDYFMLLLFPLGSYLGAVFTLFLFSFTQHGSFYSSKSSFGKSFFSEFFLFSLHLIPVNFMVLNLNIFMDLI